MSSVLSPSQAKAAQRGGAAGRAGNMRQCVLFLSSLVPFVLAPRPPDEPGFGSPQRLGKDPADLASAGTGCLERAAFGEEQGSRIYQVFGGGVLDDGGASLSLQRSKGVWPSEFRKEWRWACLGVGRDPGGSLRE